MIMAKLIKSNILIRSFASASRGGVDTTVASISKFILMSKKF